MGLTNQILWVFFLLEKLTSPTLRNAMKSFYEYENEFAIRSSTSRLKNKGLLRKVETQEGTLIQITQKGRSLLLESPTELQRLRSNWDGRWRLVVFDIPEASHAVRDRLRRYLTSLGFGMLQKSVWISPYDLARRISDFVADLGLSDLVRVFEGTHLNRLSNVDLAYQVWGLDELNKRYTAFVKRCAENLKRLDLEDLPVERICSLLEEAHESYSRLAEDNPFLPLGLLKRDWKGEIAKKALDRLRKKGSKMIRRGLLANR